jgi:uncharacterized protein (TIGR00297 family)
MGSFALLLRWLTPFQAAACAVAALAFNLLLLHRVTRRALLREHESERAFSLGIALYPAAVLVLILVFWSRLELAAATWALLAFGDGMATVAGVTIGSAPLPWNREKSWAGFLAFVIVGTFTSALLLRFVQGGHNAHVGDSFVSASGPDTTFLVLSCLAAALAAAFAESLRTGIDDNALVPLVGGTVLYAATLVEPDQLAASAPILATNAAIGAGVNAALALSAWAAGGVRRSGAISGWFLGTLLYTFAGWRGFVVLLAFFLLGTATTKIGFAKKAALGVAQEAGGRRGASNVFANGTAGLAFAFLASATPYTALFLLALAAAFATAAADTVSSEIGQAFGRRHFLVTTLKRVPAGTEGAVSLEGTLAGIGASALVAATAFAVGIIDAGGVAAAIVGAFIGTTLESYLGATLEARRVVDNEIVNFLNTVAGGLAACAVWGTFP